MSNQEQYEEICDKAKKYDRLVKAIKDDTPQNKPKARTDEFDIFVPFNNHSSIWYKSTCVPRVGEIVHFPHFGGYVVKQVAYRISDDSEDNHIMWVELEADKYTGQELESEDK